MARVSACWDREVLLSAYLDGELTPDELAEVVVHLESCADCIAVFRQIKEARAAVRRLPMIEMPTELAPFMHLGDRLSAFLDGELAEADLASVGRHLAACADCRGELRELDSARTAVRALPRLEPALAGAPKADSSSRRWPRVAVVAVAAAAVAVLFVGGGAAPPPVDRDTLANRHGARTSVEQGFAVIPAFATPPGSP